MSKLLSLRALGEDVDIGVGDYRDWTGKRLMAFAEDLVRLAAYTDSPAAKQFILHRVYMVYDGPSNGPRQLLESKMAYKSYEAIRAEDPEMCSPPDSWVEPDEWRLRRV